MPEKLQWFLHIEYVDISFKKSQKSSIKQLIGYIINWPPLANDLSSF
jgi:hypothetical protein